MKEERWQRIRELLEAVLERPPKERASFLEQACGSDRELRKEVESLIDYRDEAENFLENPPVSGIQNPRRGAGDPEFLPSGQFPVGLLSPGQILGSRFQIGSLLGRGGLDSARLCQEESSSLLFLVD